MARPAPYNPQPLQQADVYLAVYNFVQGYALPALEPANIFRAWPNRAHLPPASNEYAVITLLYANRRGTNAQKFDFDPQTEGDGVLTLLELKEAAVQIDFYADDDSAEQRASALELVMRSELASLFFAPYGISPLYADDPKELTGVDGSRQYVKRYMLTLHLSFYASLSATIGWFDHVNLNTYNPDTYEGI